MGYYDNPLLGWTPTGPVPPSLATGFEGFGWQPPPMLQPGTLGPRPAQLVPAAVPQAPVARAAPVAAPGPVRRTATSFLASAAGPAGLAAGAIAGGIGSLYQVTANDSAQRENKKRLAELERLRDAGDLGLSPLEQRQLQSNLFNPIQRAAAQGRAASEQQMAAMGSTAAAGDYARIREAEARQNAAAARDAAGTVMAMDEQKKQSRLAEIEARMQAKSQYKADDLSTLFGGLAKTGAAAGAIAGAGPGTLPNTMLSVGGFRVPGQAAAGFSEEELALIQRLKAQGKLDNILAQAQQLQGGV